MSYTYLRDAGEESLAASFADIPASVLSRLNVTPERFSSNGNATESCPSFQSGMTSELSMESHGADTLASFAEDSPARTFRPLGRTTTSTASKLASEASAVAFGLRCAGLLGKFNLTLCLSKTPRHCGSADLALCCETLPRWGMMQRGECLEFASLARITSEKGFLSLLPTPTCHNAKEGAYPAEFTRNTPTLAAQIGGKVNPDWNEWRMGWPIGWTDLKPLETDKFQQWRLSHGKSSNQNNLQ